MSFINQVLYSLSWVAPAICAFLLCFGAAVAEGKIAAMLFQGAATAMAAFTGAERALWVLGDWHTRSGFLQEEILYLLHWTIGCTIGAMILIVLFKFFIALAAAGKTSDMEDEYYTN